MKAVAIISSLILLATSALGQSNWTNMVNSAKAAEVASQLSIRMSERDAIMLLQTNNLTRGIGIPDGSMRNLMWDYYLSDGSILCLSFSGSTTATNVGSGLLKSAFIRSNGVTVLSIKLKNEP